MKESEEGVIKRILYKFFNIKEIDSLMSGMKHHCNEDLPTRSKAPPAHTVPRTAELKLNCNCPRENPEGSRDPKIINKVSDSMHGNYSQQEHE